MEVEGTLLGCIWVGETGGFRFGCLGSLEFEVLVLGDFFNIGALGIGILGVLFWTPLTLGVWAFFYRIQWESKPAKLGAFNYSLWPSVWRSLQKHVSIFNIKIVGLIALDNAFHMFSALRRGHKTLFCIHH